MPKRHRSKTSSSQAQNEKETTEQSLLSNSKPKQPRLDDSCACGHFTTCDLMEGTVFNILAEFQSGCAHRQVSACKDLYKWIYDEYGAERTEFVAGNNELINWMFAFIKLHSSIERLITTLKIIQELTTASSAKVELMIRKGFVEEISRLINHSDLSVAKRALWVLGNMASLLHGVDLKPVFFTLLRAQIVTGEEEASLCEVRALLWGIFNCQEVLQPEHRYNLLHAAVAVLTECKPNLRDICQYIKGTEKNVTTFNDDYLTSDKLNTVIDILESGNEEETLIAIMIIRILRSKNVAFYDQIINDEGGKNLLSLCDNPNALIRRQAQAVLDQRKAT